MHREAELQRFAPGLKVVSYKGTAALRQTLWTQVARKSAAIDVVLTTYDFAQRDSHQLGSKRWRYLVVDEGHRLKNASCRLSTKLRAFKADGRLLLTGTPLHNGVEDLWSLLNFLMPDLFGSENTFMQWFAGGLRAVLPEGEDADSEAALLGQEEALLVADRLHLVLRPFMLRRLKEDVAAELPSKVEHLVRCAPSAYQKALFGIVQQQLAGKGGNASQQRTIAISNSVMELRNICNHPTTSRLHPEGIEAMLPPHELPADVRLCGKLDTLDKLLVRLHTGGHKCLVFCTMTRCLDVLEEYLQWRGFGYERLDGSTTAAARGAIVDSFNQPGSSSFVFLLSMRAGGVGLNLQSADTVILYDTDWNAQIDLQAQARAHRIGQKNKVLVLRLQTTGSVEERIYAIASEKRMVADTSITGGLFDGTTSSDHRRQFLLDLLKHDEGHEYYRSSGLPTSDAELDRILASRSVQINELQSADPASSASDYTMDRLVTEQEAQVLARAAWEYCFPPEAESAEDASTMGRGKRRRTERCANEKELSKAPKH